MSLTLPVAALAALFSPLAAAEPTACTALTREVTESVAASPDKVVKLTADFCAKNPACACEIVSAALLASKADASLRAEIISAALQAAPDQLEAITACTAVEEPSGKAPVGKEPAGKEPAGKEPAGKVGLPASEPENDSGLDTIDFGLFRAGIGGVYIGSPSSGTGRPMIETVPEETTTPQTPRRVIVRIPGTVSPIKSSGNDGTGGTTMTISGGTLSGSGLIPGGSPGTITLSGNVPGSLFVLEPASPGQADSLNLNGSTLAIASGASVVFNGETYTSSNFEQLNTLIGSGTWTLNYVGTPGTP